MYRSKITVCSVKGIWYCLYSGCHNIRNEILTDQSPIASVDAPVEISSFLSCIHISVHILYSHTCVSCNTQYCTILQYYADMQLYKIMCVGMWYCIFMYIAVHSMIRAQYMLNATYKPSQMFCWYFQVSHLNLKYT